MTSGGRVRAGLGVPSLTLILLTLCLTLLGTLSLADARAEQSLRKRQEALTTAYYQAAWEAQRTLACMDEKIMRSNAQHSQAQAIRPSNGRTTRTLCFTWMQALNGGCAWKSSVAAGVRRIRDGLPSCGMYWKI